MTEPPESEPGRERSATTDEAQGASRPPALDEDPGLFERVAAALKVAALAIGPIALLRIVSSLDLFESNLGDQHVGNAMLWAAILAGSGVVTRWLTLGASPFVDRAATAPFLAAGLALAVEFALRALTRGAEPYSGIAVAILCICVLGLYWSIAAPFLARDGETTRRLRQWKLRDLAISPLLFGACAAALRWLFGWFDLDWREAATGALSATAILAGIFFIPFAIDLACRFAMRSRYSWACVPVAGALSLGASAWCLLQVDSTIVSDPLSFAVVLGTSIYLPLSATLAGLTKWRPLFPTLRRLDERLRSRTRNPAIRQREASPTPSSAQE